MKIFVRVPVEVEGYNCSNSCDAFTNERGVGECLLFGELLEYDGKDCSAMYKRCKKCLRQESLT